MLNSFILAAALKYGPNGFTSQTLNSSQACGKKCAQYQSVQAVDIRKELVPGVKVYSVPDRFGLSIGVAVYTDSTVEVSLGIRL